jgi:N6-adenosine-specific RNA methylase IME4
VSELQLSLTESARFSELEQVIELGLGAFIQVGNALLEIRESRFYRNTHGTFEDYCRERWRMERAHAYRLIDASEVAQNLSPIGDIQPSSESQARPLTGLKPEQQREVWLKAVSTAPAGRITAAHVETIKNEILSKSRAIQNERWEVKKAEKQSLAAELNSRPIPLPDGVFDVIAVDPPWRYELRPQDATHRATVRYPDMSTDEIIALPTSKKAAENCVLWLWTTNAHIRDALRVADAWQFEVKTILTWVKHRMGMGNWLRGQTEHCLMCVRGRPFVNLTNQTTVLAAQAREHSRKPDEFFELVEALCPGTKLEMFAREQRPGWQSWGAETFKFEGNLDEAAGTQP